MILKMPSKVLILGLLGALAGLMLTGGKGLAFFEMMEAGPRGTALGRSYSAMAEDASAVYWNPAALVTLNRSEVLLMFSKPYGLSNLTSGYAAAAWARDGISLGLSWHHTGVSDVVSEDMITLAAARDMLPAGGRIAWAVGGALKLAHVGFSPEGDVDYGREYRLSGDLSTLVDIGPLVSVSYVVRDLWEPTFDFVEGGGETRLERTHQLGAAYRWHPSSTYAAGLTRDASGEWVFHLGGEVWFYDVFSLRTGLYEGEFTGGVGLKAGGYLVDLAFITHEDLGASYQAALRIPFGGSRW